MLDGDTPTLSTIRSTTLPAISWERTFAPMISSFPEFTGVFSSSGNWTQLLLVCYLLPVYSFCVAFLFMSMVLTGWTYREASVQICEYYALWVCVFLAILLTAYLGWIIYALHRVT